MTTFTEKDLTQIREQGTSIDSVEKQINNFIHGFPPMKLIRPATVGDGIMLMSDEERTELIASYERKSTNLEIVKFVPASGAASRMFKALFSFMSANMGKGDQSRALMEDKQLSKFFGGIEKFAFYDALDSIMAANGLNLAELLDDGHYAEILENLLTEKGLNYGNLPKGLLYFHMYGQGPRTPLEEHLVEGARYSKGGGNTVKIHFTVSPDHMDLFKARMEEVREHYETEFNVSYEVSYSIQNPATDTIAVSPGNEPFREEDGSILFRPAGHGALLENLDHIDADIMFIKNIDNVVPDRIKATTDEYKKALAGLLLQYQQKIFHFISLIDSGASGSELEEISKFIQHELNLEPGKNKTDADLLRSKLDRPIRICGMVVNKGEAGGGPFWCLNSDDSISLQIVESSQIDMENPEQAEILRSSTHFNPVDVIASPRRYDGSTFKLMKFRDPSTGFISSKSKDGRELKAMELPGLWNGSMSDWNTILVEVPEITFNPVKTVNDLLREQHL